MAYTAPERLLGDKYDQRADVFSAGVLLWEAIMGEPLFRDRSADAIVTRLIGNKIPYPVPSSDAPWAVPLSDVALAALSVEPLARFAHVGALGAQIEKIARGKLASAQDLAALVAASFGRGSRDSIADTAATVVRPSSPQVSAGSRSPSGSHAPARSPSGSHSPSGSPLAAVSPSASESQAVHLHSPVHTASRPPAVGETLGGASGRSASVARTRRAEPAEDRPSQEPSSSSMPVAPSDDTRERTSSAPAEASGDRPSGVEGETGSRVSGSPSASALEPGARDSQASGTSSPLVTPATMVSLPSGAGALVRASEARSERSSQGEAAGAAFVAPVTTRRRPPPMSARRQWMIVGSAVAASFTLAGLAAYALLDWNPVSTANETVLVPPPMVGLPANSATPVGVSTHSTGLGAAAGPAGTSASSASPMAKSAAANAPALALSVSRPPVAAAPPPVYRPPVAAPVRPAPQPAAHPAPGPTPAPKPAPKPVDKQSETERFGI